MNEHPVVLEARLAMQVKQETWEAERLNKIDADNVQLAAEYEANVVPNIPARVRQFTKQAVDSEGRLLEKYFVLSIPGCASLTLRWHRSEFTYFPLLAYNGEVKTEGEWGNRSVDDWDALLVELFDVRAEADRQKADIAARKARGEAEARGRGAVQVDLSPLGHAKALLGGEGSEGDEPRAIAQALVDIAQTLRSIEQILGRANS